MEDQTYDPNLPLPTMAMFETVEALTRKDIRAAGKMLTDREASFLVDYYYIFQNDRIRFNNQIRTMAKEPNLLLNIFASQSDRIEQTIKKALADYVSSHIMGEWLTSIHGIGPVLSAGLISTIDITKAPTAGHIWSFAGYNPLMKWEKGQKRPYSAGLKTLCWKIGQSFMKFSGNDNCFYGKLYKERKQYEVERNEKGELADQAKHALATKNFRTTTDAYKHLSQGKLPPAHIDARARRWAVKMFLSHLQQVWYEKHFGEPAPKPFAISILGHAHMIQPPIDSK
jgi:hypothetical protein